MGATRKSLHVEFRRPGEPVDLGTNVSGDVVVDLPGSGAADRVTALCTWADGRGGFVPAHPPPPTVLHEGPLPPGTTRLSFALPVGDGPLGFRGGIEVAWGVQAALWKGRKEVATLFAPFATAAPGGDFRYRFPPGVEAHPADDVRVSRHTAGNLLWGAVESMVAASLVAGLVLGIFEDGLTTFLGVAVALVAAAFAAVHLRSGLRNLRGLRRLRGLELRVPVRTVRWGEWVRAEVVVPPGADLSARVELSCVEGYEGGEGDTSYRNVIWSQSEAVPRAPEGVAGPAVVEFQVPVGGPPTYRSQNQWLEWRLELHAWPGAAEGRPFWAARALLLVCP